MAQDDESVEGRADERTSEDVLDSWKAIATYLQRDVRTVMRWERTRALPVRRLPGSRKAAVYALRSELDAWRATGSTSPRDNPGEGEPHEADSDAPSEALPSVAVHRARWLRRPAALVVSLVALVSAGLVVATITLAPAWNRRSASGPKIRGLVVLPFENVSRDPAQDYLSDVVHETLINDLAGATRGTGLRVISHTSAERYRGTRLTVQQIARELDVDAVIEGSVLLVGGQLRVTAQLIRAANEDHLWAGRFERDIGETINIVTMVTDGIRREVAQTAAGGAAAAASRTQRAPAVDPGAIDAYLRGRYAFQEAVAGRQSFDGALRLYRKALDIDPGFALAWNGIAVARTAQVFTTNARPEDLFPEAREAARRALALDANLTEALGVLGYLALYWDRDPDRARTILARALQHGAPGMMIRHAHADLLLLEGDAAASLDILRKAHVDDPFSWPGRMVVLNHLYYARRYEDVVSEGGAMVRAAPDQRGPHMVVASALWLAGRRAEAVVEWKRALGPAGDAVSSEMHAAASAGDWNRVLLAFADWTAANAGKRYAVGTAALYAAAGATDKAFHWLDIAFSQHEPTLLHVVAEPFFDPIRSDSRYSALLARIGIGSSR